MSKCWRVCYWRPLNSCCSLPYCGLMLCRMVVSYHWLNPFFVVCRGIRWFQNTSCKVTRCSPEVFQGRSCVCVFILSTHHPLHRPNVQLTSGRLFVTRFGGLPHPCPPYCERLLLGDAGPRWTTRCIRLRGASMLDVGLSGHFRKASGTELNMG